MIGVLITRSLEENASLEHDISMLGLQPYHAPMLSNRDLRSDFTHEYRYIVITSKFAAQIVSREVKYLAKCFVIGEESALIITQNPHLTIINIAKNIEDLLRKLVIFSQNKDFLLNNIYFSGNIISKPLPDFIKRKIIYKTSYNNSLPIETIEAIQNREIKYVMLYSKNCALNLIELLRHYNLLPYIQHSVVIAISSNVAALFDNIVLKKIHSAASCASHMLELLVSNEQTQ